MKKMDVVISYVLSLFFEKKRIDTKVKELFM